MHPALIENEPYIVGIGASAGGLEAMQKLLSLLCANGRITYVVAQHMAKDGHIELVLKALARQSSLRVVEATSNTLLEPDNVYVIPPGSIGVVRKGRIQLLPVTVEYLSSPSVNALFNSIAAEAGGKGIGIVLSGAGSDGASGCRAIKARGGMTIAQIPQSAQFSGMPSAVIDAKAADMVLEPSQIASYLNELFSVGAQVSEPSQSPSHSIASQPINQQLAVLLKDVFSATGVDFSNYKEEILLRRIDHRLATLKLESLEHYWAYILNNPGELHNLQRHFLVSLSSFFRDEHAFAVVKKYLAELVAQKEPGGNIGIWVPGCASGEECYTFAILLAEILGDGFSKYNIAITGSDLNPDALGTATKGCYRLQAFNKVATHMPVHHRSPNSIPPAHTLTAFMMSVAAS